MSYEILAIKSEARIHSCVDWLTGIWSLAVNVSCWIYLNSLSLSTLLYTPLRKIARCIMMCDSPFVHFSIYVKSCIYCYQSEKEFLMKWSTIFASLISMWYGWELEGGL